MTIVTEPTATDVARSAPQATRDSQAKLDAVIAFAMRVQNWPLLEDAIDRKIEEQEELVRWWRENVSMRRGGDRSRNPDPNSRSLENAESATGIRQIFVRWWQKNFRTDGRPAITLSGRMLLSVDEAEHATGITKFRVLRWRKDLADKGKYREKLVKWARLKAEREAAESGGAEEPGENESDMPEQSIEAAPSAVGGIDLDPAAVETAQRTNKAEIYFTPADDGLAKQRHGSVPLDPPSSQPGIGQLCKKLAAGRVTGVAARKLTDGLLTPLKPVFARLVERCAKIVEPRRHA